MTSVRKLIKLEIILQSEINRTQDDKYGMFSHMHNLGLNLSINMYVEHGSTPETMKGWKRSLGRRAGK